MSKSIIDIARECGACNPPNEPRDCLLFSPSELDVFAERIRADERASLALPAGMPEPVARASKGPVAFFVKWTESGKSLRGAAIDLYTADQVQAMLAAAPQPVTQPSPAAVERKPLTLGQIGDAVRAAHIAFCLDKFPTFEHAIVHFTEQAHGIAAQQGDKT